MNALRISLLMIALAVSGCSWSIGDEPFCANLNSEQVVAAWDQTQACTGITGFPLPEIRYDEIGPLTSLGNPPVIYMNTVWLDEADCDLERYYYKHEFVHALLHYAGFPIEDNKNHQSEMFGLCGGA